MNCTRILVELGVNYINEFKPNHLVCAFAGGSVGIGDADEYSDLDLNYFVTGFIEEKSINIQYKDQTIQLHIHSFPDIDDIYQNPWDYRFLLEAKIIYDPKGALKNLLFIASTYFRSNTGRLLMRDQARKVVLHRLQWLEKSLQDRESRTASIAIRSAIIDAGFYYSYFTTGKLSTSGLLNNMKRLSQMTDIERLIFKHVNSHIDKLLTDLIGYRAYLRDNYNSNFALDPVQDELIRRKLVRFIHAKDLGNIYLHVSSEAFWCFLSISKGSSFENHFSNMPVHMQESLISLGYGTYSIEEIEKMKAFVEGIMREVEDMDEEGVKW